MQVISIIVSSNESPVLSVDSFGVLDDENKDASIEVAEDFYVSKCKELMFGEGFNNTEETDNFGDVVNDSMDDGYIKIADYTVSLVWSSIDNIQM